MSDDIRPRIRLIARELLGMLGEEQINRVISERPPFHGEPIEKYATRIGADLGHRLNATCSISLVTACRLDEMMQPDPDGPDADTTEIPAAEPPIDYHK